ncbi:MAG: tyrosine-type recombinase/integrase [Firmicutes bacterium]|nr:tyrosine-type recombinase/integrase [Bacillota bacterium]
MKYHQEQDAENLKKLDEIKSELPSFCARFFLGLAQTTSPLTRLAYAGDLKLFFEFLSDKIAVFAGKSLRDFVTANLEQIEILHIELFLDFVSRYERDGQIIRNGDRAKHRKLSCLRSFFAYLFDKDEISKNVLPKIKLPKIYDKPIVRLEGDEANRVLETIGDQDVLTKGQLRFRDKTEQRDYTLIFFFLATGVRVSELIGLDIGHIDLKKRSFKVTRKGGSQEILYMSDELYLVLEDYLEKNCSASLNTPLFKSIQGNRLCVRQARNIVKKYASIAVPLKNITPHKLRSTFGTNLYRETGDIYAVADVLGHKDVNTTKKHYAAISEDTRREMAKRTRVIKDE